MTSTMTSPIAPPVKVAGDEANSTGLHIRKDDEHKIINMLIRTYSSKVTPVREIVVNGLEVSDHVEVDITTADNGSEKHNVLGSYVSNYSSARYASGVITITDHGEGMTEDFIRNYFLGMGSSTKGNDENATGGKGIGAKSVLSIANSATWRSTTKDGMTTVLLLSRNDDRTDAHIETFKTDEPTGTTVTIPVDGETITRIIDRMGVEFFDYVDPDTLTVTVDGIENPVGSAGTHNMDNGDIRLDRKSYYAFNENDKIMVIGRGNIPYPYTIHNLTQLVREELEQRGLGKSKILSHNYGAYTIRYDVPRAYINPHREALEQSDVLDSYIIDCIVNAYEREEESMLARYEKACQDVETWRKFIIDNDENGSPLISCEAEKIVHSTGIRKFVDGFRDVKLSDIIGKTVVVPRYGSPDRSNCEAPTRVFGKNWKSAQATQAFLAENSHDPQNVIPERVIKNSLNIAGYFGSHYDENIDEKWVDILNGDREMERSDDIVPIFDEVPVEFTGNVKEYYEKLFDITIVDADTVREDMKKKGREIISNNPQYAKKNTTKRVSRPVYLLDGYGNDHVEMTLPELRSFIEENSITQVITSNDMYNQNTPVMEKYHDKEKMDILRNEKKVIFVVGVNAGKRIQSSLSRSKSDVYVGTQSSLRNVKGVIDNSLWNLFLENNGMSLSYSYGETPQYLANEYFVYSHIDESIMEKMRNDNDPDRIKRAKLAFEFVYGTTDMNNVEVHMNYIVSTFNDYFIKGILDDVFNQEDTFFPFSKAVNIIVDKFKNDKGHDYLVSSEDISKIVKKSQELVEFIG